MPADKHELASIIEQASTAFAETLSAAAKTAATEADIRSAADRELLKVEQVADITLEARHEFTVASGRVDSVYDRVIVEYKNPQARLTELAQRSRIAARRSFWPRSRADLPISRMNTASLSTPCSG